MDFDWTNIGYAVLLGALLVALLPRTIQRLKETPKATNSDWISAIKPLIFVVIFVIALIVLVS